MAQLIVEIRQLTLTGQVSLEQQPSRFLKAALTSQRLHGDAAIFQAGTFAVDKADCGFGDGDIGKTGT